MPQHCLVQLICFKDQVQTRLRLPKWPNSQPQNSEFDLLSQLAVITNELERDSLKLIG